MKKLPKDLKHLASRAPEPRNLCESCEHFAKVQFARTGPIGTCAKGLLRQGDHATLGPVTACTKFEQGILPKEAAHG